MSFLKLSNALDLDEHIQTLLSYFMRAQDGIDIVQCGLDIEFIRSLQNIKVLAPKIKKLSTDLVHLEKSGVLRIESLFEFIKIRRFFAHIASQEIPLDLARIIDSFALNDPFWFDDNFYEGVDLARIKDARLDKIAQRIKEKKTSIKNLLNEIMQRKALKELLVSSQIYYINGEDALLVRAGFTKVIDAQVLSRSEAGFFYISANELRHVKKDIKALQEKEQEIIYEFEQKISASFSDHLDTLKHINASFDLFDGAIARLKFASSFDLQIVPTSKMDSIVLKKFHHPAIKNSKSFNLEFNQNALVITGLNAGGKTMLLKSILSACFMAKMLIPFKCDEEKTSLPYFKEIYAVIEDGQSIKDDISTFSSRMKEFAKILTCNDVLIGVDEIELGTDADEASALFSVIVRELIEKRAKVVLTTHHKRLAASLANNPKVELLAAMYDEKNKKPLYDFLKGVIGKSYAFETAISYGIDPQIVDEAKKTMSEEGKRINAILEKASFLEKSQKNAIDEINKEKELLQKAQEKLNEEMVIQAKKSQDMQNDLMRQYNEAIFLARQASKEKNKSSVDRLVLKAQKTLPKKQMPKRPKQTFYKDEFVRYLGKQAQILSLSEDGVLIEVQGKKIHTNISKLQKMPTQKQEKQKAHVYVDRPQSLQIRLDLHGLRAQEALEKLEKFISDSLVVGYDELHICHGIGTGVLSKLVRDYLKSSPHIKRFCTAAGYQGGAGTTIAYT